MKSGDFQRLRLLSYNIQAGIYTRHFGEYLTKSWKHVLPHRERLRNLGRIAAMLHKFDLVGLQEVDAGSLRSGFVDQTEYLAHRAGFPHWYKQINRSLGKLAQHSNGVLSRVRPGKVSEHRLPGLPGRGAILCQFGGAEGLTVCILHLALGRRARLRQVHFLSELMQDLPHVVIMGDLNCSCDSREMQLLMQRIDLRESLCHSTVDPQLLSSFQRILLTTDGTVTEILEAHLWEAMRIVKLYQDCIETDASIPYLDIGPHAPVLVRKIILRGESSERNYIYAESIVALDRLDDRIRQGLIETQKPVGQLMLEARLETFREILVFRGFFCILQYF